MTVPDYSADDKMPARLIRGWRGCRTEAYMREDGVWAIGMGSTKIAQRPVIAEMRIDIDLADRLLTDDLRPVAAAVDREVRVKLRVNERAALISFAYARGVATFRSSRLLRRINDNELLRAADEFLFWVHIGLKRSPELAARRARERAVFLGQETV